MALVLITVSAGAQSVHLDQHSDKHNAGNVVGTAGISGSTGGVSGYGTMGGGAKYNARDKAVDNTQYTDAGLAEMAKQMEEREWGSEDTAWARACKANTREAYQRYAAKYPNGAHIADAYSRMIDMDVNDIFNSPHNAFPKLNVIESDDQSDTCTVTVENHTGYPMTVMFSGQQSKSIVISPGMRSTVTLPVGNYRIAASVPDPRVRPYAGSQHIGGGRYETGFVIVHTY